MQPSDWTFDVRDMGQFAYIIFAHKIDKAKVFGAEGLKMVRDLLGPVSELVENVISIQMIEKVVPILEFHGFQQGGNATKLMYYFEGEGYFLPPGEE